ncbi:MAG: M48 family metalloprotease [Candidatus Riflebacteria bacterium]|nr:M48 family metalloprotease [Candidatus Riflebacteria bacterium]
MKPVYSLLAVLLMLVVGGIIVMKGEPDNKVGLSGVMELVGDAQRTALKPAMMVTRVTPAEEMELGRSLASQMHFGHSSGTKRKELKEIEEYINRLGQSLLGNISRKEIVYEFHLINRSMVNAFALPGGQIFVFRGLVDFVESEAELAAVLGHEITHVDARHCIEMFQAEMAAEKITGPILGNSKWLGGMGMRMASHIIQGGYRQYQEFEADARGLKFSVEAGYDPKAAEKFMARLGENFEKTESQIKASDPVEELQIAVKTAAGSYFRSHPPTPERVKRLQALGSQQTGKQKFYIGKENLKLREIRAQKPLDNEFTTN